MRDGHMQLDNGFCRNAVPGRVLQRARPAAARRIAAPNEVQMPTRRRRALDAARAQAARPAAQRPLVVYKPAAPGQRLGVVLEQIPRRAPPRRADNVTLVLAKPLHGVVPSVVGLARSPGPLRQRGSWRS